LADLDGFRKRQPWDCRKRMKNGIYRLVCTHFISPMREGEVVIVATQHKISHNRTFGLLGRLGINDAVSTARIQPRLAQPAAVLVASQRQDVLLARQLA